MSKATDVLSVTQIDVPEGVSPLNKEAYVAQASTLFKTPVRTGYTLEPSAPDAPTKVSKFTYYSGVRIRDGSPLFPENE